MVGSVSAHFVASIVEDVIFADHCSFETGEVSRGTTQVAVESGSIMGVVQIESASALSAISIVVELVAENSFQ